MGKSITLASAFGREFEKIFSGAGYFSFTHILTEFRASSDYFYGETVILQLLVVPRVVWSDKPVEYGASQINDVLGYPTSTLEAYGSRRMVR